MSAPRFLAALAAAVFSVFYIIDLLPAGYPPWWADYPPRGQAVDAYAYASHLILNAVNFNDTNDQDGAAPGTLGEVSRIEEHSHPAVGSTVGPIRSVGRPSVTYTLPDADPKGGAERIAHGTPHGQPPSSWSPPVEIAAGVRQLLDTTFTPSASRGTARLSSRRGTVGDLSSSRPPPVGAAA